MITHNNQTYKVVIVTPAGREKYLSFFKKYIYKEMERGLVDGWQLWQNTVKESDIAYLKSMEEENPKVKVYTIPNLENKYNFCDTLRTCEFFLNCHDDDTIYIRLDDDIVWYEKGALEKIAKARIACPNAFVIYPNILNSTTCSQWHQEIGAIGTEAGVLLDHAKHPVGDVDRVYLNEFTYTDSKFIDLIHDTFKKRYEENTLAAYYLPNRSLDDYQRFSICSICFWGKDKVTPGSFEEAQMAWELPAQLQRPVFFVGDALMVHYSYHTQIDYLESCEPQKLEFYKKLADNIE